jgi:type III secretion protein HrpB1
MDNEDYLACDRRVLRGLIETLSVSLITDFPRPRVNLDDVDQLLTAVRILMPDVPEIGLFEGLLLVAKGQWMEAGLLFRTLADRKQCYPDSKALLGYCLSAAGDPEWKVVINEVLEADESPNATGLARLVLTQNDYANAVQAALQTGVFVEPQSMLDMKEERAAKAAEAAAATNAGQQERAMQENAASSPNYLRL